MRCRKLRIAWSVAWGMVGLALSAACFVLQYRGADIELMRRSGPGPTIVQIHEGKLCLSWEPRFPYRPAWAGQINRYGFRYNVYSSGSRYMWGPLWVLGPLLSAAAASFAASLWLSLRFSLRTLIIATTLVAVVLGLIVWLQ